MTAPTMIETRIPARLDALPWTAFHTRLVIALGVTWILDGLEVTLAGSVAGALRDSPTLALSEAQVGLSASLYLAGAVLGALGFGWLADRHGRKRLFWITLAVYALGTLATAFSHDFLSFAVCRMITGAGIGGEYSAINSAIQEWIPARHRGRTDLIVNGSFWIGAGAGALGSHALMASGWLPQELAWRLAFGIGAVLALAIIALRGSVPESPRWLVTHGRAAEAEALVARIEAALHGRGHRARDHGGDVPDGGGAPDGIGATSSAPMPVWRLRADYRGATMTDVAQSLLRHHRRRTLVALTLMSSQAFCYNAIFFTFALVLGRFYDVPARDVGLYLLPFAIGNFLGPLLLGHWFDTIGRRVMITSTYAVAGVLLIATALLFAGGRLGVTGQTLAWSAVFFFASAAASSAYLTVGESFPIEIRALAIALFYAMGTALGGIAGPWLFGELIGTGSRGPIAWGYVAGALSMLVAAAVQWRWGLDGERRALEDLASPLSGRH
ncbi:MAG: MFS transporter [Burkholderiaceae bacterium]